MLIVGERICRCSAKSCRRHSGMFRSETLRSPLRRILDTPFTRRLREASTRCSRTGGTTENSAADLAATTTCAGLRSSSSALNSLVRSGAISSRYTSKTYRSGKSRTSLPSNRVIYSDGDIA